ncbi:MAG: DUF3592 domain-containing protein [Xenococcaceae cyanobacterium]
MKSLVRTALIPFVLGLPMLIFGVKELYQVNRFVKRGAHVDGIIVEMKKGPSILSKYHPRVRFQTLEGKTIEFTPGNGSNPPMYEVNDHVPVVYNRDDPNYAVINSFIEIWLGPVIYAGLGLLLLVYSSFQWVKSINRNA